MASGRQLNGLPGKEVSAVVDVMVVLAVAGGEDTAAEAVVAVEDIAVAAAAAAATAARTIRSGTKSLMVDTRLGH